MRTQAVLRFRSLFGDGHEEMDMDSEKAATIRESQTTLAEVDEAVERVAGEDSRATDKTDLGAGSSCAAFGNTSPRTRVGEDNDMDNSRKIDCWRRTGNLSYSLYSKKKNY